MMFVGLLALAAVSGGAPAAGPAARVTIAPGLWEVRNVPGAASLDGRVLRDLPLSPIRSERVCVTPAEAAATAAWFARDIAGVCRIMRGDVAGGRVAIRGVCPTDIAGREGALTLDGHYAKDRFTLAFTTTTPQPEGVLGFTGAMSGRRVGACPAR